MNVNLNKKGRIQLIVSRIVVYAIGRWDDRTSS